MAQSIHISVHIAVAAGAGVGRIALGRARRRGDDCLVAVFVRELRDGFGLRLAAARAGIGPDAGLRRGRLLGHFAAVPCVAERIGVSIHVAVAAGAGVGRVTLGRASWGGHNSLVAVGMGNIIVMDVGVFQCVISGANCNAIPCRLSAGEIYICERSAARESVIANARHTVWNRYTRQRRAARESIVTNARYAARDRIYRKSTWTLHQSFLIFIEQNTGRIADIMTVALSDPYTGQRGTTAERSPADACHTVRDRHACKRFAISESTITNAPHAV